MIKPIIQVQLGKQGISDNFIQTLKRDFQKYKNVKVSVLRSARENKEDVKKHADTILEKLGEHYTAKIIGFTIALKKWKKPMR
ncbi:MAG: YhbY family RNA-binding protein [Nanoarchaeota archaeon]|nr:YhbY family RNA-binding protein [Nanoarchaeota archaeon]MBU4116589.1 YhbY family RNA-binding protein [Nanoarchaeota archaeon]